MRLAREFCPHIIVLDLRLPDANGLDLIEPLMAYECGARVIVFSMYEDPAFAARALKAGAKGYITKNDDPDVLLQAIEKVDGGGTFLAASMAEKLALLAANAGIGPLRSLSNRERHVFNLLGQGRTLVEIADQLGVSYRTSASIAAQIKSKLNITSMAALIKLAVEHQSNARA